MAKHAELVVLVADAARAELLRRRGGSPPFETIATFDNPDAHRTDHELGKDRPGRAVEPAGTRRSAMEPRSTPRARLLAAFATELAAALERQVSASPGLRLVLAAPPRLMRMIEARLGHDAAEAVSRTVPKDLTKLPRLTLHQRLADMVAALRVIA